LGIRVRKLSDDPIYVHPDTDADPEKIGYVYAQFDDLHATTKQRWCSIDYRPEGLKVFETKLNDSCP
jgi:hypothetical protein